MNPPYRVAVAVPCGTECKSFFAMDLALLVGYSYGNVDDVELAIMFHEGSLISPARQDLVERALRIECTHILWLDSDMRFPKNTLEWLLSRDKDIVGCNYAARRYPHGPTAFAELIEGPPQSAERLYTYGNSEGVVQCAALGFGVCLTQTHVFEKIEQPWFAVGYSPVNEGYQGEDIFFALRARKVGLTIWCDHDLSKLVKHIGPMEYTTDSSLALLEMENDHKLQ